MKAATFVPLASALTLLSLASLSAADPTWQNMCGKDVAEVNWFFAQAVCFEDQSRDFVKGDTKPYPEQLASADGRSFAIVKDPHDGHMINGTFTRYDTNKLYITVDWLKDDKNAHGCSNVEIFYRWGGKEVDKRYCPGDAPLQI